MKIFEPSHNVIIQGSLSNQKSKLIKINQNQPEIWFDWLKTNLYLCKVLKWSKIIILLPVLMLYSSREILEVQYNWVRIFEEKNLHSSIYLDMYLFLRFPNSICNDSQISVRWPSREIIVKGINNFEYRSVFHSVHSTETRYCILMFLDLLWSTSCELWCCNLSLLRWFRMFENWCHNSRIYYINFSRLTRFLDYVSKRQNGLRRRWFIGWNGTRKLL